MKLKKKNHNILDENPLKYFLALCMGVISTIISIVLIIHSILVTFDKYFMLEGVLFKLHEMNFVYGQLASLVISFYMLFAVIQGYESLCIQFPQILGYNQMHQDLSLIHI